MSIHSRLKAEADEAEAEVLALNTEESEDVEDVNEPEEVINDPEEATPEEDSSTQDETEEEVPEETDWQKEAELNQQRYNVLQGKFNAEVPRLQAENRRLQSMVEDRDNGDDYETPPDDFEEDFPDVAQRINPLDERLSKVEQGQYEANLFSLIPNLQAINQDPAFLQWLGEIDPFSGATRKQSLDAAAEQMDAYRIAKIFDMWQTTQQPRTPPKPNLSRKLTPQGTAGSIPKGKRTYTEPEVEKFYKDVRSGKYRGKESNADAIERDLFAAEAEGRIIY